MQNGCMKIQKIFIFILGLGVFSISGLMAKNECKQDRVNFCKDIKPGEGRIFQCLVNNFDKLSPECKSKVEKNKQKWEEFKNACGSDLDKFCPNTPIGKGRIHSCLAKNKDQLSEQCKNFLIEKKEERKKKKEEFRKLKEIENSITKEE